MQERPEKQLNLVFSFLFFFNSALSIQTTVFTVMKALDSHSSSMTHTPKPAQVEIQQDKEWLFKPVPEVALLCSQLLILHYKPLQILTWYNEAI